MLNLRRSGEKLLTLGAEKHDPFVHRLPRRRTSLVETSNRRRAAIEKEGLSWILVSVLRYPRRQPNDRLSGAT
jgi:hypothetical protein